MPLHAPPRMGRAAQRFAFACASTFQEPSRSSSEHSPPPRSLFGLLRLYYGRGGSALSHFSLAVRGDSCSSRTIAATHSPSSPPYREVWSIAQPSARVRLLGLPVVQPHPTPSLHQRSLWRCVGGLWAVGTPTHERSFSQAAVVARNGRLATPYAPEYVEVISANFGKYPTDEVRQKVRRNGHLADAPRYANVLSCPRVWQETRKVGRIL